MEKKSSKLLVIIALCGMMGSSVGICMNSLGVFYTTVAEYLGVGRGTFAMCSTLTSVSCGIFQILVSNIYSNTNFKKIYLAGVILAGLALVGMSFSRSLVMFYVLAVLLGAATSCFNTVTITTILNHSIEGNIGSLLGFIMSFSGLVGALMSPLITAVISSAGWQKGYLVLAAVMVLFNIPGLVAKLNYGEKKAKSSGKSGKLDDVMPYVYCLILSVFTNVSVGMSQHLTGFSVTRGLTAAQGSLLVSAMMIGNISFKVIAGMLSDKLGSVKTAYIISAIATAGTGLLLTQHSQLLLSVGAFGLGSLYSIPSVLAAFYIREFYGLERYTNLYAIFNLVGTACFALALSVVGYVYDFTGSYVPFLMAVLLMDLLLFVTVTLLNRKYQERGQ